MSPCDSPCLVYSSDFWKQSVKHEADSQVLQRVQARERLLGHRADLVPLQKSGKKEKKKPNLINFRPHFCSLTLLCHGGTLCDADHELTVSSGCPTQRKAHSCLQWSKRFHSFGDPFSEETKTDHIVKTPHPANDCSCDVNKTLCGFTFRVRGEKRLRL